MEKIIIFTISDLKNIFRDKTLLTFLTTPITLVLFVRFFVPYLASKFPLLVEYYSFITMFGSVQTAIMFGFITSFVILEEKDENVLQAIRILPITPLFFIAYRLLFATFFSCLGAFTLISLGGLVSVSLTQALFLSSQFGLTAPFITLIVATFAKNKVEGMAFFKGVDLLLLLPILSFLMTSNLKYIFGIIPVFWTYQLFDNVLNGKEIWLMWSMGTAVYLGVLGWLYVQFKKRVFDR